MARHSRRVRELVQCAHCGKMVAKSNAQIGANGQYVGGACLKAEIAVARLDESKS